jgi:hypothetical protein
MNNLKQIDELTDKLVPQVLDKIYKLVDHEMESSDIDFEPDGSECVKDYQEAHDYIMNQLLNKLNNQKYFNSYENN